MVSDILDFQFLTPNLDSNNNNQKIAKHIFLAVVDWIWLARCGCMPDSGRLALIGSGRLAG